MSLPTSLTGQRTLAALLTLTVTAFLIVVAVEGGSSRADARANGGSSVLDRPGRLVTLAPREARFLHEAGFRHVYLLATRNRHDYYRLIKPHRFCYGVGLTALHRPGQIKCFVRDPAVFVDFSVAESTRGNLDVHLWRLEGMAHDSVATVGMIGTSGQLLVQVSVREGIYYLPSPPADPIAKIVAYDAQGRILAARVQ